MDKDITIREAQATVDEWIRTVGVRYFSPLTNMSAKPGEKLDRADELADVLWVVMAIANQTGVDLAEAFGNNLVKKSVRDCKRHIDNPKLST